MDRSCRSHARRSASIFWKANCSGMCAVRLPARSRTSPDVSKRQRAERFCSTKSVTWRQMINLSDLPDKILASPDKLDHSHTLEQMERRHIEVVLEQAMTLEEAAEMLGINVATLWRKRRRYGLD